MSWDRKNLFVIAGFVSTYSAVILPGFQMFSFIAGFVIAGFHCYIGGLIIVCSFFSFTGRWAYIWGLLSEKAGVATCSLRYSLYPLGEVLPYTSHIGMWHPKGYGFCAVLGLKTGIDFAHFGLESGVVYKETTVVY